MSHASRKTKRFCLACKMHSSHWPFPQLLCVYPGPSLLQAQRILPQTRWEPLGKRAIVRWEGLHLDGCGETRGFRTPSQPIPPGNTFLEGGPSLRKSISWMSWRNISECTQQRKLHPPRGDHPQICLWDSKTNTAHCSPQRKERPAPVKPGAALEHGVFCSFLFQGSPSPALFQPCVRDLIPWHQESPACTPRSLLIRSQDTREAGGGLP